MTLFLLNRYFYPDETATSRMCTSLAFGLAARGVALHVLCGRQRHDGGTDLPAREIIDGVTVTRLATSHFGRARIAARALDQIGLHAAFASALRRLVCPGDGVIVCTDPALLSVTAAAALAGKNAVMVTWLHDLYPEVAAHLGVLAENGAALRTLQRLRDRSLRAARLNVVPIDRMAADLAARGVPRAALRVVHHWSEGGAIRPIPSERNPLRTAWGLQGKVVVGYSGNMGRAHDFGTILDAADALKGRPDIVFLFVGGGHRRTWIKTEVARRALTNVFIQPLQPRERLAETLGAADIHLVSLLPDLEGCIVPSKLYGILAAGRMTLFVGDPDGETARTIAAGNCGITVRIGDWPRLAELIVAYAEHPGLRHAAGARARELFDTRFTEAVGIDAWESILNELKLGGSAASLAPVGVVETPA